MVCPHSEVLATTEKDQSADRDSMWTVLKGITLNELNQSREVTCSGVLSVIFQRDRQRLRTDLWVQMLWDRNEVTVKGKQEGDVGMECDLVVGVRLSPEWEVSLTLKTQSTQFAHEWNCSILWLVEMMLISLMSAPWIFSTAQGTLWGAAVKADVETCGCKDCGRKEGGLKTHILKLHFMLPLKHHMQDVRRKPSKYTADNKRRMEYLQNWTILTPSGQADQG